MSTSTKPAYIGKTARTLIQKSAPPADTPPLPSPSLPSPSLCVLACICAHSTAARAAFASVNRLLQSAI